MDRVIIERSALGTLLVRVDPADHYWKKRFTKFNANKRFSGAVGYASRLAAGFDCQMIDRTGRLSEAECEALVDAMGAERGRGDFLSAGSPVQILDLRQSLIGMEGFNGKSV